MPWFHTCRGSGGEKFFSQNSGKHSWNKARFHYELAMTAFYLTSINFRTVIYQQPLGIASNEFEAKKLIFEKRFFRQMDMKLEAWHVFMGFKNSTAPLEIIFKLILSFIKKALHQAIGFIFRISITPENGRLSQLCCP